MRLPADTQRATIIGRTGSGKSTFAVWLLSHANWTRRPWVIIDYKRDELINDIPGLEEMRLVARIPRKAGLYVVHPRPDQQDEVEALLWKIWEKERVGLLLDEAYLVPNKQAFSTLLVTGRSKKIPMIMNTQRPSWVPRHMWSESDFFSVFHLNDRDDQIAVERFVPIDMKQALPQYHSWYFDVARNETLRLSPVPNRDTILRTFEHRAEHEGGKSLWNAFTSHGPSRTGLRWS